MLKIEYCIAICCRNDLYLKWDDVIIFPHCCNLLEILVLVCLCSRTTQVYLEMGLCHYLSMLQFVRYPCVGLSL